MNCLVVVDMQNDFIDGSLGTKEAQAIIDNVVRKIEGFDGMIAVTKDTHLADYLNTQEGTLLPVEHCIEGQDGWRLNSAISGAINKRHAEGTPVEFFFKQTFGSLRLGERLQLSHDCSDPIDEVVLVGLCTDICVISNALLIKAFLPEVKITVDAACCAGVTPESHKNALKAMQMCQISVENWEE